MTLQEIQYKAQAIMQKWRDEDSAPYIEFVEELALMTVPEEPDKSLEEEIQRLVADYSEKVQGGKVLNPSGIEKIARYFAQWGAKHLRGSTKMIDKSLEEAAEAYQQQVIKETKNHIHLPQHTYAEGFEDALHLISDAFIAGFEYRSECEKSSIMGDLLKTILKVGVQHNFGFGPDLKQCKDNEDESK